jgi:hypothetical protein
MEVTLPEIAFVAPTPFAVHRSGGTDANNAFSLMNNDVTLRVAESSNVESMKKTRFVAYQKIPDSRKTPSRY